MAPPEVEIPQPRITPPEPPPPNDLDIAKAAIKALGFALSARVILLLSIVFAFVLAVIAALEQNILALCVLVAFAALGVIPMVILEARRNS